jgi:hypothetical protein
MHARRSVRSAVIAAGLVAVASAIALPAPAAEPALHVAVTIDAAKRFQRIDGFGVNVTPAQWRGGALKPTLDLLVDDLGTSLVRLDCYGKADWLDPAKRGADGRWPEAYLAGVYRSPVFAECWDTLRHLTGKGVDVHLNLSGRIPAAWAGPDGQTLVDLDAYAEAAVSQARWAREKEGLRFATFAPFNETNLGFPEGPKVRDADVLPAVRAVAKRLDAAGLGDVKLVVACDAPPIVMERFAPLLAAPDLVGRVLAFSTHTYGDGDEGVATPGWYDGESERAALVKAVAASPHKGASLWMTEYGDLDQTGLIEWQFAWRSARRLLRMLEDGFHAAIAWDAFDNLHEHDGLWATYGLLATDRSTWTHAPKKRYFAAKQVYRFVRPGWRRVAVVPPARDPGNAYAGWQDPMRHVRLLAFTSPDGQDVTLVGMSRVEGEVELEVRLGGLAPGAARRALAYYRTTRTEDARLVEEKAAAGAAVRITVPEGSIFTLTTLRSP